MVVLVLEKYASFKYYEISNTRKISGTIYTVENDATTDQLS